MWGGSISSCGPLRNLNRDRPAVVVGVVAAGRLEVQLLEAAGDWSHLGGTHGAAVDLHDGCDLVPGPREEHLISRVEFCPVYVALLHRHPELPLGELHYRVACDPFQNVRRHRWGDQRAL